MRFSRSLLAVFAVGTLTLSLTACGGDDGGLDANASAEDLAAAIEEANGGEVSADEIEEAIEGAGLSELCLGQAYVGAALFGAMSNTELDGEAQKFFDDAAEQVPDEIKDDFAVLAAAMTEYGAVLAEFDNDFTKAMADPDALAAMEALGSDEVAAASDNVTAWFDENCTAAN